MSETNKIIQSYVHKDDKCFFVSTINRLSSAMLNAEWIYAETMVWNWDEGKHDRGELIWQGEDVKDGTNTHFRACKSLLEAGVIGDDD